MIDLSWQKLLLGRSCHELFIKVIVVRYSQFI